MWKCLKTSNNISQIIEQIQNDIKNGSPVLENLRFVFTTIDNEFIHMLTPFDLIDNYTENQIKLISLYQVLNN